ncbi:MAG: CocE/NonD family hydrolase [Desulfosalsimonadaceae bacterium]
MEYIFFDSKDGVRLEGLWHGEKNSPAAIITHPHPLYGGTMNNYVLDIIESAFLEKGYATLRFNFRGVGKSSGSYSDGKGEIDDVIGAVSFAEENGADRLVLAGYSFGAWVNAQAQAYMQPTEMVMISPPVAMMDFSGVAFLPALRLVVTGENDEIAPPETIQKHLALWNPEATLRIIENGDHFYGSSLPALKAILKENTV